MRSLRPWPIVLGLLVDFAAMIAIGAIYILSMFGVHLARGGEPAASSFGTETWLLNSIEPLSAALGGFVAGRVAGTAEVRHGFAVGVAILLLWASIDWVFPAEEPAAWYDVVLLAAAVPGATIGGYAASVVARRSSMR